MHLVLDIVTILTHFTAFYLSLIFIYYYFSITKPTPLLPKWLTFPIHWKIHCSDIYIVILG